MDDRDLIEGKFKVQNGDKVDLLVTRSENSNVSDEDFNIIIENTYKDKLVYCDSIDISFYKNKPTVINIEEKIALAGLPGIKVVIGNYK